MKILNSKMYNRKTKDTEYFIKFTDKELKECVTEAGLIQEDYICMTSFNNLEHLGQRAGTICIGMEHNQQYRIGFYLEHKWDIQRNKKCFEISLVEHKKVYKYNDNVTLPTLQRKFLLDIIKDGYLIY